MTDRTVTVTLKANVKPYIRAMRRARRATNLHYAPTIAATIGGCIGFTIAMVLCSTLRLF